MLSRPPIVITPVPDYLTLDNLPPARYAFEFGATGNPSETTGSITSGQATLTVADVTGFAVGDHIAVLLAGTGGGVARADGDGLGAKNLRTTITAINGTTFTLAANAGTTQAAAVVTHDYQAPLQAMLDETGFLHVPAGDYPIGGRLRIRGGTTLTLSEGATVRFLPDSHGQMLQNYNRTTQDAQTITDEDIVVEGGLWDGNGDNQVRQPTGEAYSHLMFFSGVRNLRIRTRIRDPRVYHCLITNFEGLRADLSFENDGVTEKPNMDGLNLGKGEHARVWVRGTTFDDFLAITANDIPANGANRVNGPINDVIVYEAHMVDAEQGIRILSAGDRIDNIDIRSVTGTCHNYALTINNFTFEPLADIGRVRVGLWDVRDAAADNSSAKVDIGDCTIESLMFDDFKVLHQLGTREAVIVRGTATIEHLGFRSFEVLDSSAIASLKAKVVLEGAVTSLAFGHISWASTLGALQGTFIRTPSGLTPAIGHISIGSATVMWLNSLLELRSGTVQALTVTNVREANCDTVFFFREGAIMNFALSNYVGEDGTVFRYLSALDVGERAILSNMLPPGGANDYLKDGARVVTITGVTV